MSKTFSFRRETSSQCKTVFKMFLILGITWTLDIIGWGLITYDEKNIIFQTLTSLFDLINSLQGVILFGVMYFNSSNLKKIERWVRKPGRVSSFGRQTSSGTDHTTNATYQTNLVQPTIRIGAIGIINAKDEVNV